MLMCQLCWRKAPWLQVVANMAKHFLCLKLLLIGSSTLMVI